MNFNEILRGLKKDRRKKAVVNVNFNEILRGLKKE